jgi:hypothetical protein
MFDRLHEPVHCIPHLLEQFLSLISDTNSVFICMYQRLPVIATDENKLKILQNGREIKLP